MPTHVPWLSSLRADDARDDSRLCCCWGLGAAACCCSGVAAFTIDRGDLGASSASLPWARFCR